MTTTMQLEQTSTTREPEAVSMKTIHLPSGLRGFSGISEMEIVSDPEQHPLMWLRDADNPGLRFLVAEPAHLFDAYSIEIFEEDVKEIGIRSAEEARILNILTYVEEPAQQLYANQVGPILINRNTGVAKQVIIQNYQDYSPRLPLLS